LVCGEAIGTEERHLDEARGMNDPIVEWLKEEELTVLKIALELNPTNRFLTRFVARCEGKWLCDSFTIRPRRRSELGRPATPVRGWRYGAVPVSNEPDFYSELAWRDAKLTPWWIEARKESPTLVRLLSAVRNRFSAQIPAVLLVDEGERFPDLRDDKGRIKAKLHDAWDAWIEEQHEAMKHFIRSKVTPGNLRHFHPWMENWTETELLDVYPQINRRKGTDLFRKLDVGLLWFWDAIDLHVPNSNAGVIGLRNWRDQAAHEFVQAVSHETIKFSAYQKRRQQLGLRPPHESGEPCFVTAFKRNRRFLEKNCTGEGLDRLAA
jgi:hypothetical protein